MMTSLTNYGRLSVFLYSLFILTISSLPLSAQMRGQTLPIDPSELEISTNGRPAVSLKIEIADTDETRATGLMFRSPLAAGRGMLFVFDETRHLSFWMKDTPSPLDLVFADEEGVVVGVRPGVPYSLSPIEVDNPSRFVLEIAKGMANHYGIAAGTVLKHPAISRISQPASRADEKK